jgi:hypothetical protein
MSIFMAMATIYKYIYHTGIRADKQNMRNVPLDRSVRLKLMFTKHEINLLDAKLEPHVRNIRVPTQEQLHANRRCAGSHLTGPGDAATSNGGGVGSGIGDGNAAASSLENGTVSPLQGAGSHPTGSSNIDSSRDAHYQPPVLQKQYSPGASGSNNSGSGSSGSSSVLSPTAPTAPIAVYVAAAPSSTPSPAPALAPAPAPASAPVPPELICPLTHQVMTDPVICADGYTYDRKAIEQHFRSQIDLQHQLSGDSTSSTVVTSPLTKERLATSDVYPNRSLQAALEKFRAAAVAQG